MSGANTDGNAFDLPSTPSNTTTQSTTTNKSKPLGTASKSNLVKGNKKMTVKEKRLAKRKQEDTELETAILESVNAAKKRREAYQPPDEADLYFQSCAMRYKKLSTEQKGRFQIKLASLFYELEHDSAMTTQQVALPPASILYSNGKYMDSTPCPMTTEEQFDMKPSVSATNVSDVLSNVRSTLY